MKPFLGINLTLDKNNTRCNGEELLTQKPSAALEQALEASMEKADTTVEKAKLPLFVRIIQYTCGILALVIVGGILRAEVTVSQAYENAPWIFWVCGGCGAIWAILWLLGKGKENQVLSTDETKHTLSRLEGVADAIYTELKVPEQARDVDLLSFFYKEKDGKIKVCEKGAIQYINPEFKIYADSQNLYLANLEGKYAIPQTSIVAIRTVKKYIRVAGWNKPIAMNKGIYKQFKLTADQYGCVHCQQYTIMEVNCNGQRYGIYIPSYELPVFEALTGKKAQEQ